KLLGCLSRTIDVASDRYLEQFGALLLKSGNAKRGRGRCLGVPSRGSTLPLPAIPSDVRHERDTRARESISSNQHAPRRTEIAFDEMRMNFAGPFTVGA